MLSSAVGSAAVGSAGACGLEKERFVFGIANGRSKGMNDSMKDCKTQTDLISLIFYFQTCHVLYVHWSDKALISVAKATQYRARQLIPAHGQNTAKVRQHLQVVVVVLETPNHPFDSTSLLRGMCRSFPKHNLHNDS